MHGMSTTEDRIDAQLTPKPKKLGISVTFDDSPELMVAINSYRLNMGWTWKRMVLVGTANSIIKAGDNPDLVLKIAEYLEAHR